MIKKEKIQAIIAENKKRNQELFHHYNPLTGEGSPIKRFEFVIDENSTVFLPEEMLCEWIIWRAFEHGSLKGFYDEVLYKKTKVRRYEEVYNEYTKLRLKHDFEFHCFTCSTIKHKTEGIEVPFTLNYPQRKTLKDLEDLRLAGKPIRGIIDKARQWGGSTLIQNYLSWIQTYHKVGWNSAICADVESQARNIRSMYTRLAKNYPREIGSITFIPFEGDSKNRFIIERQCIVGIGSMQKPDNLRSYDFSMLHLSECGVWKKTDGKSPEDLAQALRASIPTKPLTVVILESTAKGVGNFFHKEWLAAINKESGYTPIFIAWFEIEMYWTKISDYSVFIRKMDKKCWEMWEEGATLEGIKWHREFQKRENYDDWRMGSEFPTTWQESFQSTGRRAFSPLYVRKSRLNNRKPEWIGELYADSVKGKGALRNIKFNESAGGNLYLWAKPDTTELVANRYCLFGDIGGRSLGADYSVITVMDRYWMMESGAPEAVATWRGHLDQDLFAWKFVQLATWFNKGLAAMEVNSLKTLEGEGDHHYTILDEISEHYDNLFAREDPEKVREGAPLKWGFHTNVKSKPMIIDCYNAAIRDDSYIENDARACDEADTYEIKDNGSYGAVEGSYDDILITRAGASWLALKYMDPVKVLKGAYKPMSKKIVGPASF